MTYGREVGHIGRRGVLDVGSGGLAGRHFRRGGEGEWLKKKLKKKEAEKILSRLEARTEVMGWGREEETRARPGIIC